MTSVTTVGNVADILNGYAFDSSNFNDSGQGLPIVRIRDVTRGWTETFYYGDYESKYVVRPGDLLIGMDGEFNIAEWQKGNALLNQRVCKIIPKSGTDKTYLKYRLSILLQEIEDETPFVTVKHLSSTKLLSQNIDMPPLDEQKRIATILEEADQARRMRRFTQSVSDTFLQEIFVEMFGDLAECWQFRKLGQLADVVSGVTKGQKFNGRETIEVPYLRVANVQDGYLDLSEIKTIRALPSEVQKYTLQPGDVVMTEGGDYDKLGRGAIWNGEIEGCIHQNHIFRVRVDRDCLLPQFFAAYLQSTEAKLYFLGASKQTTNLASINMTQLRALPVPLPPMELQRDFADTISKFERVQNQQNESARQAEHLFQTLLHRAFRGEL